MSTPTIPMTPHHQGGDMIESDVMTWNSKVANAILAQVQGTYLGNSQREHPAYTSIQHIHSRYPQLYARRRSGRRTIAVVLPGAPSQTHLVESVVAHHSKGITHCIPEEILGIDRELPEATRSIRCGESSPCPSQTCLGQRPRPSAATVE